MDCDDSRAEADPPPAPKCTSFLNVAAEKSVCPSEGMANNPWYTLAMRRRTPVKKSAAGLLILVAGIALGVYVGRLTAPTAAPPGTPGTLSTPTLPAKTEAVPLPVPTQPPALTTTPPPAGAEVATVSRVIDGDTIELTGGERVRYIGVDTPETVDPRKKVQCFGIEASNENKKLLAGRRVRLEKDVKNRDNYGRLLRYVYVGDTFINLVLVQNGFAHASPYPPDVAHEADFRAAEAKARAAKLGLWGACPPTSRRPSTPNENGKIRLD